ncbi:hypothetical protein M9Y10_013745 [Tritrichomonas musculus]|uniref:Uncharacterized protein n=1 Tax=Tritrichomonas musculus TaxID=1915356 RepID=A0ABR2KXN3_9EUKA
MDSFQEQMRLQAAYNEYTDSIRQGLTVATNILKVLAGAVQLVSELSNLTVSSDNMTLNTYRTEDFHFPGFPGGGYPGKDISGQFLLNMDTSTAGQILKRFIPTQTTIPAATSTLTATNLVMEALDSLTQIGNATTTLKAGGMTIDRVPTIIDSTRTIVQSMQTFTDSVHELCRRWRERGNNTIVDHSIENSDEMELEDLDDSQTEVPVSRLNHDYNTTSNTATSSEILFGNHTVESLSNLTVSQLLDLDTVSDPFEGPQPGEIVVRRIGDNEIGFVIISRVDEKGIQRIVYTRRCDNEFSICTPERLRLFSMRPIYSGSQWVVDEPDGSHYTARDIELMDPSERLQFEASHPQYIFIRHVDRDLGVNWTEVRDSHNSYITAIDIYIAVRTNISNDEISIQSPENNVKIDSNGINITTGPINQDENNVHELVANEYNVVVANHELEPITDNNWTVPNMTPAVSLADIEQMDWWQRHKLINDISSSGNVLSFRSSDIENDNEEYTEVLYNNKVVGVIDHRHLNQVTITDNDITITNPHTSLALSDHDIQWMRNDEQQQSVLSGLVSNISSRIEQFNNTVEWLLDHPNSTNRVIAGRGSSILVPIVDVLLYIPRMINSAAEETLALLSDSENENGLNAIIDWCTSNGSDISLPDETNEAVSLNSCVNICKTFRDTVKGHIRSKN